MSRKVERFEDLIAWEKAMDVAVEVYGLTRQRPFSRDFALSDQIRRAVLSVPSNIAEGFERGTRAEFHHFLSIAKGSCAEVRSQLYLAERLGYIDQPTARATLDHAEEVSRIIGGLRVKVAAQRKTPKK
jgi:four helix bundle protein